MKYQIQFNPARKMWIVWRVSLNGSAEVIKNFKTQSGAEKWVAKQ